MDTTTIIKRAKILNYVEIAITLLTFIMFKALNPIAQSAATMEEFNKIANIEKIGLAVMGIVSVVVIVMTALMMKQNQKRVKGLGLLLASGIVTLVFAILGVTLGLIIWILSGLSLKNLTQKAAENNFEAQLQSEMVAAPVEVTVTEQAAENTETEETQQM